MGIFNSEKTSKKQIVIHHTAGTGTISGVIRWWLIDKWRAVGTPYIIDRLGEYKEVYDSNLWSSHIGIKSLDKYSVGIEMINWGFIKDNKTYVGSKYEDDVEKVRFKGYSEWQPYTDEQISTLEKLIKDIGEKHNINTKLGLPKIVKAVKEWDKLNNKEKQKEINDCGLGLLKVDGIIGRKSKEAFRPIELARMGDWSMIFDINSYAMQGREGVWTHVNYRKDKFDCYPSKKLIDMLYKLS